MHYLEIKEPHYENHSEKTYTRLAMNSTSTFRWKTVAFSKDRKKLVGFAEKINVANFFDKEREYNIFERN